MGRGRTGEAWPALPQPPGVQQQDAQSARDLSVPLERHRPPPPSSVTLRELDGRGAFAPEAVGPNLSLPRGKVSIAWWPLEGCSSCTPRDRALHRHR